MANTLLLKNCSIVDGSRGEPLPDMHVLIEDETVVEVSDRPLTAAGARQIDFAGRTLMPGLIDCHVHVIANSVDLGRNALQPDSLVTCRSLGIMRGMLMRGFTTVRDVGGADHGLVQAVEEGAIEGPRLVISGKALSQTGGHTDFRGRFDRRDRDDFTHRLGSLGRLCDGVDEVRRACREELRAGANFLKLMANGGVASPTDPIHCLGFSRDEIAAAVEEAGNAGTYVSAHLYTDRAVRRAVELGVHSLEHCNLVTPDTARLIAERGAFVCPTLVTYEALQREGASVGLPAVSVAKIDDVRLSGLRSLEILRDAGVTMVYGTDLLGPLHRYQADEFVIRRQVLPAKDVIRSATLDAARLLRLEGKVGCVAPGAFADLIAVDGDPLSDLSLLANEGRHIPLVLKGGRPVKNELDTKKGNL